MGKPSKRRPLNVRDRRAAKAVAQGRTYREAAKKAGFRGKRAAKGVTVAELMQRPDFRALVDKYLEEEMTGSEWEARVAGIARYKLPSAITQNASGDVVDVKTDALKALYLLGRARGKLKEQVELGGPGGGPLTHALDLSKLTDKDLDALDRIVSRATAPKQ